MARFSPLSLAYAALALGCAAAGDVNVHVRVHHHQQHHHQQHQNAVAIGHAVGAKAARKVFHVSGSKAAFDELLTPSMQTQLQLDVWRIARAHTSDGKSEELQADIAATDEAMAQLQALLQGASASSQGRAKESPHKKAYGGASPKRPKRLHVKQVESMTEEQRVARDRKEVAACLNATMGYETTLATEKTYASSAYFDCFRPSDEIWQFFDTIAEANPDLVTKIHNVSTTYEGRSIHAYKLSSSNSAARRQLTESPSKKAVYIQSLIHAREWQAGASTHYTFASLLDDLRAGDAETLRMFEQVDWYFVPLVNADGYIYSWEVDRYWRVNRHPSNGYEGVDLNRNFPPVEYFNVDPSDVSDETNPGDKPLSEPEARGVYDFMMGLPDLIGVVDVHAYAGMVLRPFSDVAAEPEEPYGSAMKRLGDSVRDAMSPTKDGFQYISQPSGALYPAYGCLDDAVYRATNYTVPALTIEVKGDDFIAPQKVIRDVGRDVNNGLRRFVKEALAYRTFIVELDAAN